jgi:ketosteroid isomerase-like protein
MNNFHESYTDLSVTITNVFASPDGSKVAIEWLWDVARKSDGARSLTSDAIIVDLVDGKIASWREYFDLSTSVEGWL